MAEAKKALPLIAAGTYLAMCHDIAVTKSGTKETPQIEAIFKIQQPGSEFDGRGVGWRSFLTEKTAEKTLESLEILGLKEPADNIAAIGKHWRPEKEHLVSIVVDHEDGKDKEGNEKKFARVRWVNSAGGAKIKAESKMDDADLNDFARNISALFGKGKAATTTTTNKPAATSVPAAKTEQPRPKTAPPKAAQPEDDDIPF